MTLNAFGRALLRTGLAPEQAKERNIEPLASAQGPTRDPRLYAQKCKASAARKVAALEAAVAKLATAPERGDQAEANIPMQKRRAALETRILREVQHQNALKALEEARARLAYWAEKAGG